MNSIFKLYVAQSYGETNYFSSLKRPEPVSINDLPETVKGSTSTKYHESNCEDRGNPRTLELNVSTILFINLFL